MNLYLFVTLCNLLLVPKVQVEVFCVVMA